MAGVRLGLSVDAAAVRQALAGLVAASVDLRDPFEEIGASLLTSTQQRVQDEEDPDGVAWPELAEATRQRRVSAGRVRGPDHILRVRGHLYGSLTYLASSTAVEVGTTRVYGAIHQMGGTDDMAPGPAAVPARPYLGVSEADEREIGQILVDHLMGVP